jgi:anti-sigma regulatory factor (Ser/Thr protein kinase)
MAAAADGERTNTNDDHVESGAAPSDAPAPGDEVVLTMPASPELLRVARLAAAGLAGRMGFSFDAVEDVKIAVDELCFALIGGHGRDGVLTLTIRLGADSLEIEGVGRFDGPGEHDAGRGAAVAASPTAGDLSELSALILGAVVDEHELSIDGDGSRFRLLKRRG